MKVCSMNVDIDSCPKRVDICGLFRPANCPELVRLCYSDFKDEWVEEAVERKNQEE